MPYDATVIRVMIASPSDVTEEHEIIRAVIDEWNAVHSEDRGLVLAPTDWRSNAVPEMGDRPQAMINKQLLENCDLLVAVFWTRLGTPTGEAPSGTVEEIRKHADAKKPVMIYFSNASVPPDTVDGEQYRALQEFRRECEGRALVETYDSLEGFGSTFRRQLAQKIIAKYGDLGAIRGSVNRAPAAPARPQLSDAAQQLLLAAALDEQGQIQCVPGFGYHSVQTNGKEFTHKGDPRGEARWRGALSELARCGLIEAIGPSGQLFRVTDEGYKLADELRGAIR